MIVERETGLATLARRLSTAATQDEVTGVVFTDARTVVGAFHANVGVVEPGGALAGEGVGATRMSSRIGTAVCPWTPASP